ncbi:NAD(P)-dependent oxidoreductase [Microbacterium sp. 179-B 1A2 NHS]|uniref:NAD(P)-dependent oxidoreductase n=1 Tax=Microbacterium sp. 179-B 1A2 NHS TaxID=3142383 RepID=UPI0039A2839A
MGSPPRIGFIALGNLGMPMAVRLLTQGFDVVAFDTSEARRGEFAEKGGTVGSIEDVLDCTTVCVAAPDERALRSLLDDGTLSRGVAVTHLVLHSTVLPTEARALAADLAELGVTLVEAPVSGGPGRARTGELSLFLGGEEALDGAVDAVLDALATERFHLGPIGSASAVKLANQLVLFATVDALHEAFALTSTFDVEPADATAALTSSTGDTWAGRNWGFFDDIVADYDESGSAPEDRPWRKDLREFVEACRASSLPAPLAEHVLASVGDRIEQHAREHAKRGR